MKTILGLIIVLSLTGCFQRINITEIKQAEKFCEAKLGVRGITEYALGATTIHCISGDKTSSNSITITDNN